MEGATLGAYRIESELGSGGMGKVFLAEAVERCAVPAGTRVALKVVHPHLLSEPGIFKRFLREAEIGRTIVHPNVVCTLDADALLLDGRQHNFLVMEYVEGQTLRDLLAEMETVPEELCRHIGREVSKGLAAIHEAGVVHRDLKPENVLITPDHEVKVMDLGVARLADEAMRLSQTGAFVGSPRYAAPEQFRGGGRDLDGRADLHALGLVLYELSSGRHPYPAEDIAKLLQSVLNDDPLRLSTLNPQLSPFFEEIVHTLLAKDREERFLSARDLLGVLLDGEESTWWSRRAQAIRAETKRPLRRIRIPKETAVYGREAELARLRTLYERARDGEGGVLLIEGEAGIGKTRLVDELVGRLLRDGEDVNFLFGSYPPGGAATATGAWSTAYREHFGAEGLPEILAGYLTVTPLLIPAFSALLRGEPPPEGMEALTKDSLQTVFVHATRSLADERTTIVLIEDLHFAPEEGRALFSSLALAVPEHRILLLGTSRPGLPERWRGQHERLELPRLGPEDLAKLLVDAFGSERLAEDLGQQIVTKSDGNPFFAFEIIRGLREGQFIAKRPDGTWVSTREIGEIRIPSSVWDLIQARIADLDEEEQEILDVAACCGYEFDPLLVGRVLGQADVPLLRRLGQIERTRRIVRAAGRRYVFDHHQVQEALYGGLSEILRERYHVTIGEALETENPDPAGAIRVELCEHFLKGGSGERALSHLHRALDHLEHSYLNDRAVELASRALKVEGLLRGLDRMELLLRSADRLMLTGRRKEARKALEEAVSLADDSGAPLARARVRVSLGRLLVRGARYEEARETLLKAMDLARKAGDESVEAQAVRHLGRVSGGLDKDAEARAYFERALELARGGGKRREVGLAEFRLGAGHWRIGEIEEARQHYGECLAIFRELGDRLWAARTEYNLMLIDADSEDPEVLLERLRRNLALFRELGDRSAEAVSYSNIGSDLWSMGRMEEAGDCFHQYLSLVREIGEQRMEARARLGLGSFYTLFGDRAAARKQIEAARGLFATFGVSDAHALSALGDLAEQEGALQEAIEYQERALALLRESEPAESDRALLALGSLLAEVQRTDDARRRLEQALSLGMDSDSSETIVHASCRLSLLPGGDSARAQRLLAEHERRLFHHARMRARFLLWRATRDPAHLQEAHSRLCFLRDHAPEKYRETMITNVPLHREIMAAWAELQGA